MDKNEQNLSSIYVVKCQCGKEIDKIDRYKYFGILDHYYCENCGLDKIAELTKESFIWLDKQISWLKGYQICYATIHNKELSECKLTVKISSGMGYRKKFLIWNIYGIINGSRIEYPDALISREFKQEINLGEEWSKSRKYVETISVHIHTIMGKIQGDSNVIIESDYTLLFCENCSKLSCGKYDNNSSHIECNTCRNERYDREVAEISRIQREKKAQEREAARLSKSPKVGNVYLLQSPTTAYKIGHARVPEDRLKTFHVKLPFEVNYLHIIKTNNMKKLENELHRKYKNKRINGEWFKLEPEDIKYIMSIPDEL